MFLKKLQRKMMSRLNKQQNEPFGIKHDFFCVDLVVTQKPRKLKEDYVDRNPNTEHGPSIDLNSLFAIDTDRENADSPDIIAVIGTAGSGKSTLSQKVVYSWAKGELLNTEFDLVFHLRCRELAELTDNRVTLEQLLQKYHKGLEMDLMKNIQENVEKTLIVIDGLDEFPAWIKSAASEDGFADTSISSEVYPPHMIIHLLMKGKILPGAKILVTSRPFKHLDILTCDRYIQIQGFSDSSIRQCISSICGEHMKILDKIMDHIDRHPALYQLCVIPFMCVLLGVVAKERLSETDKLDIDNMTQLLIRAVHHLYTRRGSKEADLYSSILDSNLGKLACLAYSMTMEMTLFFNGEDLKTHDITDDAIFLTGLLEITKEKSVVNIGPKESCSFIHKLVQEFLTAVHICLTWEQQDIDKITQVNDYEMDNVQLFIGGLLGDEDLGHDLLYKLITNNSNKQRNFSDDAKKFYHTMLSQNSYDNELSKIQSICCAHEGMNASLLQEATKDIEKWESLEFNGGEFLTQTHLIASLVWFLKETQTVTDLW